MAVRGAWAGIAAGDAEGPVWDASRSEPGTKRMICTADEMLDCEQMPLKPGAIPDCTVAAMLADLSP